MERGLVSCVIALQGWGKGIGLHITEFYPISQETK
jgi:hypothetical protein